MGRPSEANGMSVETDYYNLNGKNVKHVEDGKNDKKLVLTDSKKEEKVNAAIDAGAVINVPSNEVVSKMEEAYDKTEKSGNEHGFVVGRKGESSKMVEGEKGKITSKEWAAALDEIVGQGDLKSYDVHTHPNTTETDGKVGTPTPSVEDMAHASSTHPDAVLGYHQTPIPPPSNQIGGSGTVLTERHIGFFNSSGSLTPINGIRFDSFKSTVKKINKQ